MTESEYRKLVLADLDEKLANRQLPLELVSLTRKSLKGHCINICAQRFEQKDELLLSSVFGKKDNQAAYIKAIQNSSAEVFRTLHNFLNDRSINTAFNNICMLAWMIDFELRPYHAGMKSPVPLNESKKAHDLDLVPNTPVPNDRKLPDLTENLDKTQKKFIPTPWVMTGLVSVLILSIFIYKATRITGLEQCMIWDDDHYEPINCSKKNTYPYVYPINRQLIDSFQKVTRPDTLSLYSTKKIWYIKTKGQIEFYTFPGPYPLDSTKRLLPMSDHILKKYVLHLVN